MKTPAVFCSALLGCVTATASDLSPIVCTLNPVVCESVASSRFDAQLQRLLAEQKLQLQPTQWTMIYFYMPVVVEDREIAEFQIRYLEELLAREKAKLKDQPQK